MCSILPPSRKAVGRGNVNMMMVDELGILGLGSSKMQEQVKRTKDKKPLKCSSHSDDGRWVKQGFEVEQAPFMSLGTAAAPSSKQKDMAWLLRGSGLWPWVTDCNL